MQAGTQNNISTSDVQGRTNEGYFTLEITIKQITVLFLELFVYVVVYSLPHMCDFPRLLCDHN